MGTAQIAASPCRLSSPRSLSSTHTQRHWDPKLRLWDSLWIRAACWAGRSVM